MKGFKTILFNSLVVMIGALLPYLAGIDWTQFLSPTWAVIALAVINGALRIVTNSPVFKPK